MNGDVRLIVFNKKTSRTQRRSRIGSVIPQLTTKQNVEIGKKIGEWCEQGRFGMVFETPTYQFILSPY